MVALWSLGFFVLSIKDLRFDMVVVSRGVTVLLFGVVAFFPLLCKFGMMFSWYCAKSDYIDSAVSAMFWPMMLMWKSAVFMPDSADDGLPLPVFLE